VHAHDQVQIAARRLWAVRLAAAGQAQPGSRAQPGRQLHLPKTEAVKPRRIAVKSE